MLRKAYDPLASSSSTFHGSTWSGTRSYRFAHPEAFGDVAAEDARRYGRVLDRYASLVEPVVGEIERDLGPATCCVVVSGLRHGAGAAVAAAGGHADRHQRRGGTHAGAPDGVLLVVGDGIRPGAVAGARRSSTSPRRSST